MADKNDRQGRIGEMLGNSKPKKKKAPHRNISFNGTNHFHIGGDLTIGRKVTKAKVGEAKRKLAQQRGWRDEARIAIRERAFQLKLTEDQVIALASSLLKKFVPSLESLTAAELGRVFDSMHNMKRPALD